MTIQDDQVSPGGHRKEGRGSHLPNMPGKSQVAHLHVSSLPHHLLCMWSQGPKMSGVQGGTSNSPVEVIFFICPFLSFISSVFPMSPLLYLPRHRYAEKACLDLDSRLPCCVFRFVYLHSRRWEPSISGGTFETVLQRQK